MSMMASHARAQLERMVREQELPGAQYIVLDAERTLLDLHVGVADVATGAADAGTRRCRWRTR